MLKWGHRFMHGLSRYCARSVKKSEHPNRRHHMCQLAVAMGGILGDMRTFIAVLTFTTFAVGTYSVTRCDAPAVATGDPANITCHFTTDIGQARKPFGIDKYNASGHEALLRCHWSGGNTSVPKCTSLKEGLSYDGNVTSYMVLKISSATDDYVGKYSCQELGSDETVEFCRLQTGKDSGVSCDAQVVTSGQPANITCHFDSDIGQTRKPFGINKYNAGIHTALLRCHWPDNHTSAPKCPPPKPGYSYDGNASTKVVLKIPSATEEYAGNYTCLMLGSSENPKPCSLGVRDQSPVDETSEKSGWNAITISVVVAVLPVFLISLTLVLYWYRGRIRRRFPSFKDCRYSDDHSQSSNEQPRNGLPTCTRETTEGGHSTSETGDERCATPADHLINENLPTDDDSTPSDSLQSQDYCNLNEADNTVRYCGNRKLDKPREPVDMKTKAHGLSPQ